MECCRCLESLGGIRSIPARGATSCSTSNGSLATIDITSFTDRGLSLQASALRLLHISILSLPLWVWGKDLCYLFVQLMGLRDLYRCNVDGASTLETYLPFVGCNYSHSACSRPENFYFRFFYILPGLYLAALQKPCMLGATMSTRIKLTPLMWCRHDRNLRTRSLQWCRLLPFLLLERSKPLTRSSGDGLFVAVDFSPMMKSSNFSDPWAAVEFFPYSPPAFFLGYCCANFTMFRWFDEYRYLVLRPSSL